MGQTCFKEQFCTDPAFEEEVYRHNRQALEFAKRALELSEGTNGVYVTQTGMGLVRANNCGDWIAKQLMQDGVYLEAIKTLPNGQQLQACHRLFGHDWETDVDSRKEIRVEGMPHPNALVLVHSKTRVEIWL